MKVRRFIPDADRHDRLRVVDREGRNRPDSLHGQPLAGPWKPVAVALEPGLRPTDFPSPSWGVPVVSRRACDALSPHIATEVESLPLRTEAPGVVALSVLFADCLDPDRAEIERFADDQIMKIRHYACRADCIRGRLIFKLPESTHYVLVTEPFMKVVERAGPQAARFIPLDCDIT
jgi:hypothetical protein